MSAAVPAGLTGRLAALQRRQQQQQQQQHDDEGDEQDALIHANEQQRQRQQQQRADAGLAGIAARLAVLEARQRTSSCAVAGSTNNGAAAAAAEGSSSHAALLQRLQVLQQRQAPAQEAGGPAAAMPSPEAGAGEASSAAAAKIAEEQCALLQRLQVVQQRQAIQQAGDPADAQPLAAPAAAIRGNASSHTAATAEQLSLLQRLQVLQQRQSGQIHATATPGSYADGDTLMDCSTLQNPGDFVECMRQLLASGEITGEFHCEGDEVHCEDGAVPGTEDTACLEEAKGVGADMACESKSCNGTAAGTGAAAAAQHDTASPMCTSPVHCNGNAHAAELPSQQPLQQQQQRPEHNMTEQQRQQQQMAHPQFQQRQQQQQQEPAVPRHVRRLLVLAAQSLSAGQFAEARERAAAALAGTGALGNTSSSSSRFGREAERLLAVAVVLCEVPQQHWLAALQLPYGPLQQQQQQQQLADDVSSTAVTAADVRRAYRRLAALVHPDKCRHACAESAFKALSTAYEQAVAQLTPAGDVSMHMAGTDDGDADGWADPAAAAVGEDGAGGKEYAWWTEWEQDVAEGHIEGGAAAAGGWGRRAAAAAAAKGSQDEEELRRLSMQELEAEVERRQAGILQPKIPADAARTPFARQERLRVARSVLSARMQQQRAARMAAAAAGVGLNGSGKGFRGGGFMAAAEDDGDGWQAGVHADLGDFKRQRL